MLEAIDIWINYKYYLNVRKKSPQPNRLQVFWNICFYMVQFVN